MPSPVLTPSSCLGIESRRGVPDSSTIDVVVPCSELRAEATSSFDRACASRKRIWNATVMAEQLAINCLVLATVYYSRRSGKSRVDHSFMMIILCAHFAMKFPQCRVSSQHCKSINHGRELLWSLIS